MVSLSDQLMAKIGKEIARMHKIDIIHGDLTTSNMMLKCPSQDMSAELVSIGGYLSIVCY